MAPSSTSSCSPPAARQHNLRTKRAKTNHKASIYSKRPTRDQVVDGPPKKKKSANLDDYVRDISETVVAWSSRDRRLSREQEELDLVVQIFRTRWYLQGVRSVLQSIICMQGSNQSICLHKDENKKGPPALDRV